jgi:hypothetical protein
MSSNHYAAPLRPVSRHVTKKSSSRQAALEGRSGSGRRPRFPCCLVDLDGSECPPRPYAAGDAIEHGAGTQIVQRRDDDRQLWRGERPRRVAPTIQRANDCRRWPLGPPAGRRCASMLVAPGNLGRAAAPSTGPWLPACLLPRCASAAHQMRFRRCAMAAAASPSDQARCPCCSRVSLGYLPIAAPKNRVTRPRRACSGCDADFRSF